MRIQPYRVFAAATTLAFFATLRAAAQVPEQIRFAAIGASITQTSGYPAKLQTLLGPAYKVENEGVSACTMLRQGDTPYWTRGKLPQTFAFRPHIVSVDLGGNDSKPANWNAHMDEYVPDYQDMIDTLGRIATKPRIIPCSAQPSFQRNGQWPFGITNTVIRDEINPKVRQIATANKLIYADTYGNQANIDLTSDGVHPDAAKPGADSIAAAIYLAFKEGSIRWACIGNSITDNSHNADAYPVTLNMLMGKDYHMLNAGHSGRTLLRNGDNPFHKSNWFAEVFKFKPHIITIKLGTNDTKPHNWDSKQNEFIPDLRWMIDTLSTLSPKPRIILLTPVPAWKNADGSDPFGIRGDVVLNGVIPKIKQVAREKNLEVIDLHTPYLPYKNLTPDGVHPNAAGLDTVANILYRGFKALTPTLVRAPEDRTRRNGAILGVSFGLPSNPLAPFGTDATGRRP